MAILCVSPDGIAWLILILCPSLSKPVICVPLKDVAFGRLAAELGLLLFEFTQTLITNLLKLLFFIKNNAITPIARYTHFWVLGDLHGVFGCHCSAHKI
jgi:hypothetical protein